MKTYRDITELMLQHGLCLPDAECWRLCRSYPFGEIHGLPGSHGQLLATNGMLCIIERAFDEADVFIGHLDYFRPYRGQVLSEPDLVKLEHSKMPKVTIHYLDLL